MKTLIIFTDSWADEMDINSHFICDDTYLEVLKKIQSYNEDNMKNTDSFCVSFGSNQFNEYENLFDVYKQLRIYEISDEEATVIEKYFGKELGAAFIDCILDKMLETLEVE